MQKSEIRVGHDYVLRERRVPNAPIQRVRVLQHVRGSKWKAEWIEPNKGLTDYVESKNLVVLWKDRKPFFRDQESESQLRADNERGGHVNDSPVDNALSSIFESVGERELSFYRGVLSGSPEA